MIRDYDERIVKIYIFTTFQYKAYLSKYNTISMYVFKKKKNKAILTKTIHLDVSIFNNTSFIFSFNKYSANIHEIFQGKTMMITVKLKFLHPHDVQRYHSIV